MEKNLKIINKKGEYKKGNKYYIELDEFVLLSEENLLEYLELMIEVDNIKYIELQKNIYELVLELSVKVFDVKSVVNTYYKNVKKYKKHMMILKKSALDIILLYESIILKKGLNESILRYLLHILYNEDIICGESIIDWYKNVSVCKTNNVMKDFIEWLESEV